MAEHEVTKHTIRAVKLFRDKEKKGWGKVGEIALEIAIIVFAITFSLWMHNRSQEGHNRKNVKQFLLGVKEDMQNDLVEMTGDTAAVKLRMKNINYLLGLYAGKETYNKDTVNNYLNIISYGGTLLIPNNGRYEGFKSSGQLGFIDNKKLANLIVDHYQEHIPSLLWVSQSQSDFMKEQFSPYVALHFKTNKEFQFAEVEQQLQASTYSTLLVYYINNLSAMLERYRKVVKSSQDIIAAIDKEDL